MVAVGEVADPFWMKVFGYQNGVAMTVVMTTMPPGRRQPASDMY
jgi:hypothetical protein